jgi:hypothetical protein
VCLPASLSVGRQNLKVVISNTSVFLYPKYACCISQDDASGTSFFVVNGLMIARGCVMIILCERNKEERMLFECCFILLLEVLLVFSFLVCSQSVSMDGKCTSPESNVLY